MVGANPPARFLVTLVGQVVKTPPFHGGNMGSIPIRVILACDGQVYGHEY